MYSRGGSRVRDGRCLLSSQLLEAAAAARPDILIIDLGCEITLGLIAEVRRRVVSVEAGLGLDQAIQSVTRELGLTHPELCEELSLVTLEMRAGKRRADALRNLSDRTGQADLRQLVAILVQSDRFGTSMAESLRTHADFMRIQRRQEAEERANKVGVKLVFPIFFCILPSMFIVTAGPALVKVFDELMPLLRQTGAH